MMSKVDISIKKSGNFHLNKWYLDFIADNGEAMIFYAAKLSWHGMSVSYTSWLNCDRESKVQLKSRFRNVNMPEKKDNLIIWSDNKFGISGSWKSITSTIQERIFESAEGNLDWNCFQPASQVNLRINDRELKGRGYAEQLILTAPPWKIPMNELRWGRFGSLEDNMVWIELKEKETTAWLWLNGVRIEKCVIEDEYIGIPDKNMTLKLNRGTVLESEKKIYSVVEKIIRYIPGFNKVMPIAFLMADEFKWLSKGVLQENDKIVSTGMAIHELVNFKAYKS